MYYYEPQLGITLTNRCVRRPCFDICEVYDSFDCVRNVRCNIQNDYFSEDVSRLLCRLSHIDVVVVFPMSIRVQPIGDFDRYRLGFLHFFISKFAQQLFYVNSFIMS
jgi:hypothetical protein